MTLLNFSGLDGLIDPPAELETLGSGFTFLEGPSWNAYEKALYFSDIQADSRWRWSQARGVELVMRPSYVGNGTVYDAEGNLLVCEHVSSSLVKIRPNGDRCLAAYHYRGKYLNSPNDVVTKSDGSIWFTDPNYGRWDHPVGVARRCDLDFQGVYRIPPGGGPIKLVVAQDEFQQPNGLCFSPDESVLYIDDLDGIKAFDVQPDGTLRNCRVFQAGMGSNGAGLPGDPDGMKCDALGNVWCTARGGIWVLAPSGEQIGLIATPEITANLAWGGDDWRTLYLCMSTTLRRVRTLVASAPLPYHRGYRIAGLVSYGYAAANDFATDSKSLDDSKTRLYARHSSAQSSKAQESSYALGNVSQRLAFVTSDGERCLDVEQATGGAFSSSAQDIYERWQDFRAFVAGPNFDNALPDATVFSRADLDHQRQGRDRYSRSA